VAVAVRLASRRTSRIVHCYTTNSFAKKSGDGDAKSLQFLTSFMSPAVSSVYVMSLMYSLDSS
jgi:hypothetical protein